MSSGIIIPIAIGLVLGIAFLMLFALMFESIMPIQSIHIPPIPSAHEHLKTNMVTWIYHLWPSGLGASSVTVRQYA